MLLQEAEKYYNLRHVGMYLRVVKLLLHEGVIDYKIRFDDHIPDRCCF